MPSFSIFKHQLSLTLPFPSLSIFKHQLSLTLSLPLSSLSSSLQASNNSIYLILHHLIGGFYSSTNCHSPSLHPPLRWLLIDLVFKH